MGTKRTTIALMVTALLLAGGASYADWGENAPDATVGDAEAGIAWVVNTNAVTTWLYGVRAQEIADAEAAAAYRSAGGGGGSSYHPGTTVGECTGFSIPDYIIQRESGGNPSAHNPSGAYGCAQTLLSHYSSGSCSGLDPYSIDGQRACVDILSGGGTNLAPWAATR